MAAAERATGACLCGEIKYSFNGPPVSRVLCHCLDCRKISGSHYSDNALLTSSNFILISGTPRTFTVASKPEGPHADITSHFCGNCGSTLWRTGDSFDGYVSVRLGTLDDSECMSKKRPDSEQFAQRRVKWLPRLVGEQVGEKVEERKIREGEAGTVVVA